MTSQERQAFLQFVKQSDWTFAKTMADNPHEYTVRVHAFKAGRAELYKLVEKLIRQRGWVGPFAGRTYRYVDHDGYSYWAMGSVINRKPVAAVEGDHSVVI